MENDESFVAHYAVVHKDILDLLRARGGSTQSVDYMSRALDYNIKDGKMIRGNLFVSSMKLNATLPMEKIYTLGWCIEMVEAFFLMADDITDQSLLRRGRTCWYLLDEVKLGAVNDCFLMESFVYEILRREFEIDPLYVSLFHHFHDVILTTAIGQQEDVLVSRKGFVDFREFTPERYHSIVVQKTAYYTIYFPLALAYKVWGLGTPETLAEVLRVSNSIGEYFQIQDDFLDCYGAAYNQKKIGTDIQDAKCSWLFVNALRQSDASQRARLEAHYGKEAPESVAEVKRVFDELDLKSLYFNWESKKAEEIMASIEASSLSIKPVLKGLMSLLHGRLM